MTTKFEWMVVSPGVVALSGTPIQVRLDLRKVDACVMVYLVFFHDFQIGCGFSLVSAKRTAEDKVRELIDCGMLEDQRE